MYSEAPRDTVKLKMYVTSVTRICQCLSLLEQDIVTVSYNYLITYPSLNWDSI